MCQFATVVEELIELKFMGGKNKNMVLTKVSTFVFITQVNIVCKIKTFLLFLCLILSQVF